MFQSYVTFINQAKRAFERKAFKYFILLQRETINAVIKRGSYIVLQSSCYSFDCA